MSDTPSRTPTRARSRSTSRSRTPRRTPRGTPRGTPGGGNRRRSFISTAAVLLTTPRRTARKKSTTPQNTLRILSRALARESQVANTQSQNTGIAALPHRQTQGQIDPEAEPGRNLSPRPGFDSQRLLETPTRDEEPSSSSSLQLHLQQQSEPPRSSLFDDVNIELDGPDEFLVVRSSQRSTLTTPQKSFHDTPDEDQREQLENPFQETYPDQIETPPKRLLFSDIAIPQGFVPENAFLDRAEDDEVETIDKPATPKSKTNTKSSESGIRKGTRRIYNLKKVKNFIHDSISKPLNQESLSVLLETSDLFFDQISDDLLSYTQHSKAKSVINIKSLFLLYKRQRIVSSVESLLELADNTLPLEQIMELRRNIDKI